MRFGQYKSAMRAFVVLDLANFAHEFDEWIFGILFGKKISALGVADNAIHLVIALAGLPITVAPSGTSFVTTAPIPTTAPLPILMGAWSLPCLITALVPMYA
jgi:hypothetical protein